MWHRLFLTEDFILDVRNIEPGSSVNLEARGGGHLSSITQRKHGDEFRGIYVVVLHYLVKESLHRL